MKINLYACKSSLHDEKQIDTQSANFLKELERELNCSFLWIETFPICEADLNLIFIQSGGTENIFLKIHSYFKEPYLLLTYGSNNSLAASMEILSFLKQNHLRGEILHGSVQYIARRIIEIEAIEKAKKTLLNQRLGIIGQPSDWLIASHVDKETCYKRFHLQLIDIPIEKLICAYREEKMDSIPMNLQKPFSIFELKKVERIYHALKKIIAEYKLQGLTIRCFDLLSLLSTTSCLALSLLNDERITSACEGDVASMLSMHLLTTLLQQNAFQANPSKIDVEQKTVLFAHCTLPLSMTKNYELQTHFESKMGVAIQGELNEIDCTIFKMSNNLVDYFVQEGKIIQNLHRDDLCRTQIVVQMESVDYFLKQPYGNHHLIVYGHHKQQIERFFKSL